jgi:hypothetical protein
MVVKHQQWLIVIDVVLHLVDALAERVHVQLVQEADLHVHRQLQLVVIFAVPLLQLLNVRKICFADQHAIAGKAVRKLAEVAHNLVDFREVLGQ